MGKPHQKKYFSNLLIGFAAVSAGVFSIVYSSFEKSRISDWYFWAIIASALICFGLYCFMNAVVHKVKADLIRKQKSREQHKSAVQNEM